MTLSTEHSELPALSPGDYHLRVVARSGAGATAGSDVLASITSPNQPGP